MDVCSIILSVYGLITPDGRLSDYFIRLSRDYRVGEFICGLSESVSRLSDYSIRLSSGYRVEKIVCGLSESVYRLSDLITFDGSLSDYSIRLSSDYIGWTSVRLFYPSIVLLHRMDVRPIILSVYRVIIG